MSSDRPPFEPAVFRPFAQTFTRETHDVLIDGRPRTDYRLEYDDEGQKVVFDRLTYDEACQVQIVRKPPQPRHT
jgi:hypothetical protein